MVHKLPSPTVKGARNVLEATELVLSIIIDHFINYHKTVFIDL